VRTCVSQRNVVCGLQDGPQTLSNRMEPDALFRPKVKRSTARRATLAAAEMCAEDTRLRLMGLLAADSALKGGYTPGCSNIDMHLYLVDAAFHIWTTGSIWPLCGDPSPPRPAQLSIIATCWHVRRGHQG